MGHTLDIQRPTSTRITTTTPTFSMHFIPSTMKEAMAFARWRARRPTDSTMDYFINVALHTCKAALSASYQTRMRALSRRWTKFLGCNINLSPIEAILAFMGSIHQLTPSTRISYLGTLLGFLSRLNIRLSQHPVIKDLVCGLKRDNLRAPRHKAALIDLQTLAEALHNEQDPELRILLSIMMGTGARCSDVLRSQGGDFTVFESPDGPLIRWDQKEGKTIHDVTHQQTHAFRTTPEVAALVQNRPSKAPISLTRYSQANRRIKEICGPTATTYSIRRTMASNLTTTAEAAELLQHRTTRITPVYTSESQCNVGERLKLVESAARAPPTRYSLRQLPSRQLPRPL